MYMRGPPVEPSKMFLDQIFCRPLRVARTLSHCPWVPKIFAVQACPFIAPPMGAEDFAVQACQNIQFFPLSSHPSSGRQRKPPGSMTRETCTRSVGMSTAIKAALPRVFIQALQDFYCQHFMWVARTLRPLTPFPTMVCAHAQTILADQVTSVLTRIWTLAHLDRLTQIFHTQSSNSVIATWCDALRRAATRSSNFPRAWPIWTVLSTLFAVDGKSSTCPSRTILETPLRFAHFICYVACSGHSFLRPRDWFYCRL
ncbi:hypothetical protein C8J57DRAFT_72758 [Mycena rebaudengoi]|nr:hypothetical protein C8J57DRAFT_72758 [Mycena rebaudengoi]